jgi:competence protein ComEC
MFAADAVPSLLTDNITTLFISLCFCAAILFMQNGRKSRDSFYPGFGTAALVFFFLLGAMLYTLRYSEARSLFTPHIRQGIVVKAPKKASRSWAVTLQGSSGGKFIAYIDQKSDSASLAAIRTGDTLRFKTRKMSPTCPLDIAAEDSLFAPYRNHLFRTGISATCYIGRNDWEAAAAQSRDDFFQRIRSVIPVVYHNYGLTADEGALLEALTTGNKSRLSAELRTRYSRAGASHILALSGFHLAVVFTILTLMLGGIPLPLKWEWTKSVVIIACIVTFTLLADSPPSLVRAAIMCCLMSVSGCLGRTALSLNSLTLAAFIMLCYDPLMLKDVGFQLSFTSVLAICVIAVPCCRKIDDRVYELLPDKKRGTRIARKALSYISSIVIVSLICSIATAPLVAYYFHGIPVLGVLTNLLVSTLAVVLLYTIALWWLLFWWDGARLLLTSVLKSAASLMNSSAEWVSSVEWSVLDWSPSVTQVLLSYALLISLAAFGYLRKAQNLKLTLLLLCALLASFI